MGAKSKMSHMWVKHCYIWVSDELLDWLYMDCMWVSDELHAGYTFEYNISHLQTYRASTLL